MSPETVKNILSKDFNIRLQEVKAELIHQLIVCKRTKATFMYKLDDDIIEHFRSIEWVVTTEKVKEDHRSGTFTYVCYP